MKRMFSALVLALAGWMLTGAATAPAPGAHNAAAPMAGQYVDPNYGFSMGVPAFAVKAKDRTIVVWFEGAMENGFASNVNVLVDPLKTTRKEYLENSLATMKQTNPMAKFNKLEERKVSGRDAELLDYEATMGGRRLRFLQLLVIDEDAAYVVTCTAPREGYAAHEAEFKKCVESFRLGNREQ